VILTVLPWSCCSQGSRQRRAGRDPAGEGLVGVCGAKTDEGVPVLADEDDDEAGNRDVFPEVVYCVGRLDLGLIGKQKGGRFESAKTMADSLARFPDIYLELFRIFRLN
jgi:hypothetical protein